MTFSKPPRGEELSVRERKWRESVTNQASSTDIISVKIANVLGTQAMYVVPYSCEINSVTLLSYVSGEITVPIFKDKYDEFPSAVPICGATPPLLSGAYKYFDDELVGWTRELNRGDILSFYVSHMVIADFAELALSITKS